MSPVASYSQRSRHSNLRAEAARLKSETSIARLIAETLPLQREGRLLTALCPFHAERTPSFYVYTDHFHCFGCHAHGDVFAWLMRAHRLTFTEAVRHLGGTDLRRLRIVAAPPPAEGDAAERWESAERIWMEAEDPNGTAAEEYLKHRGVSLPDMPVIRFHPRCPRKGGRLPAMVALMTHPTTGEPSGVHRTFLQPDGSGKAAIEKPKMMLGKTGVIRLVDDHEIGRGLGLAEGIETALTVTQIIGWGPVWAATSAGAIRSFSVMRATTLSIFADHDAAGLKAARACAARWFEAGEEALIHLPPEGEDWADAAQRIAS